ncbi:hypothetical protein DFJ58DRAFT_769410 [Suillus subalutaceus]|uniref:uncharacterized protein n=1 Tax=Suillus subalutaceus TaxID=48586 RepID=UPI001B879CAE|nr:uncharacterized protein DFJ58DRAFT_769410 [Suillus subalutaceus]KAG1866488.1 hypothetical protein DFJ58DRAFT_769410 [Suillus subalutaceus]
MWKEQHTSSILGSNLDGEKASELHYKYYTQYGLALRGLTRHHDIGRTYAASTRCRIDVRLQIPWILIGNVTEHTLSMISSNQTRDYESSFMIWTEPKFVYGL